MSDINAKKIIGLIIGLFLIAYVAPIGLGQLYDTHDRSTNCTDGDPNTSCVEGSEYNIDDSSWDSGAQNVWLVFGIVAIIGIMLKIIPE